MKILIKFLILSLTLTSCNSVKLNSEDYQISISSSILEKHKLKKVDYSQGKYLKCEFAKVNFFDKDSVNNFILLSQKNYGVSESDSLISQTKFQDYLLSTYYTKNREIDSLNKYPWIIVIQKNIDNQYLYLVSNQSVYSVASEKFLLDKFERLKIKYKKRPEK